MFNDFETDPKPLIFNKLLVMSQMRICSRRILKKHPLSQCKQYFITIFSGKAFLTK